MVKRTLATFAFVLAVGGSLLSFQPPAYAVSCDAIVGEWAWFTGGNVTINLDGTITSKEVGKVGTWECTNTTRGVFTLRWIFGTPPFVDTLTLSADGQSLSGKNQFQYSVTATRISTAKGAYAASSADAYHSRGLDYFKKGMYEEAIAEFTKAIEINPKYALAYINRGAAYSRKGQHDQAIVDYTRAIEINPELVGANYNRGLAYSDKGQYDQATSDFTRVIEKNSKHAKAYYNRGRAYYNKGEYDKAWEDVRKAQELGYKVNPQFLEKVQKARDEKKQTVYYSISPEDSQEIKRLVERLNKNYRDTILFQRAGEDVFADDIIIKTRSVGSEEKFTLVQRYSQCTIKSRGWRFGGPIPSDYRVSADSIKDCDENRYGLKWEEKTVRAPLPQIKPPSIKVSESGKGDSGPNFMISFVYEGYDLDSPSDLADNVGVDEDGFPTLKAPPGFTLMRCKDRVVCDQMAADVKRLVEIARKYTPAKKDDKKVQPSADPSQLKAAWDLGTRWTIAAVFHAEGKSEKAGLSLAEARKLAKQVGAEIPDLPVIQGSKVGVPTIVRYINANRKPIISKINGAYGREAAACFDLATTVHVLQFVYEGNNTKLKSQLIEHIKKTGAVGGLPKNLWEPVVSKAAANAPIKDYNRVAVQMYTGVSEYLDGKKQ